MASKIEKDIKLFKWAHDLNQVSGLFKYDAGREDLLDDILRADGGEGLPEEASRDVELRPLRSEQAAMLRRVIVQGFDATLYCGLGEAGAADSAKAASAPSCCLAHIVRLRKMGDWEDACAALQVELHARLQAAISVEDRPPESVLAHIEAEGRRVTPSRDWNVAFEWLTQVLPYVTDLDGAAVPRPESMRYEEVVDAVKEAAKAFRDWHPKSWCLRPCQLAAVLLNVYGARTKTKLLIEMKTGEGKTFVCGVSAAVIAKHGGSWGPKGPSIILTSSVDRAREDREDTRPFIQFYMGDSCPPKVSDLDPAELEKAGAGRVAYGQVSDLQHIAVELLTKSKPDVLKKWLATCSFFIDEADHVLVEQAESLLYIASPCPSSYALHSLFFVVQNSIDTDENYVASEVQHRGAIPDKAQQLAEKVLGKISDYRDQTLNVGRKQHEKTALFPGIIDLNAAVASATSGAMSARLKEAGKQYVIERTTEKDHHGTIPGVPRQTIVDVATGTESDGTRWTTEAPFLEAMHGLPVGGSDPLAFYCAFPYLLNHASWFGGITGTVGGADTLSFYREAYKVNATFRMPRNKPTTIFRRHVVVAPGKDEQLERIGECLQDWIEGRAGVPARGPALVIAGSIQRAEEIVASLEVKGHAVTRAEVLASDSAPAGEERQEDGADLQAGETIRWEVGECSPNGAVVHVLPFYARGHRMMQEVPDWVVVVASNKGGRGMDLKLDHDACPLEDCPLAAFHRRTPDEEMTPMKSVLYVILTDVLPGRQDEQAIGRCGRSGKAGVVQYVLAQEPTDTFGGDPEAVFLQRKVRKALAEQSDLRSKSNRIKQHCWDGTVLSHFCENKPVYVSQWMLKLFPALVTKKKRKTAKRSQGAEEPVAAAEDDEDPLATLLPVVTAWFDAYVTGQWAYWRSYGADRREPSDSRAQFECHMGLVPPLDLPVSDHADPLRRFAHRFWRFAAVLRLSGEALYSLGKALLAADIEVDVLPFAKTIVKQAASPSYAANGVALTLPPADNLWQREFTGNAALLYALLCTDDAERSLALDWAMDTIDLLITRYTYDPIMKGKATAESLDRPGAVTESRLGRKTFYNVQHAEIVRQLKRRREAIKMCKDSSSLVLQDVATLLTTNDNIAFRAYCLGYGLSEVVWEFFPGDEPFAPLASATESWGRGNQDLAKDLSAATVSDPGTGAAGSAQVLDRTEAEKQEQEGESDSDGRKILTRIGAKTETQQQAGEDDAGSGQIDDGWDSVGPTEADIRASKSTRFSWQTVFGWLAVVWSWVVSLLTATLLRHDRGPDASGGSGAGAAEERQRQDQEAADQRWNNPVWSWLRQQWGILADEQAIVDGELVNDYLGDVVREIDGIAAGAGYLFRESAIYQEHVASRTDGSVAATVSRSEAKEAAAAEAEKPIHLRDVGYSEEDMYLISETLKELKSMASQQNLQGFDEQLSQLFDAIARYNELATEGLVDDATAKKMNAAMKMLWKSTLAFALTHGSKIDGLRTALDNYDIAKNQSGLVTKTKEVVKQVTEMVETVVETVKSAARKIWGWIKKTVKKVVKIIRQIPIVRQWVELVEEQVVNPLFYAAKDVISAAKETLVSAFHTVSDAIGATVKKVAKGVGAFAGRVWNGIKRAAGHVWSLLSDTVSQAWAWLKETTFWQAVSASAINAATWLSDVAGRFGAWLAETTGEAWAWLKETSVWKTVSAWTSSAISLASKTYDWLISITPQFVFDALKVTFASTILSVKLAMATFRYLRYLWQGRGRIMSDYIWGTEFDVIDVTGTRGRISRHLLRLRAGLRRVWESSWLQWFLDPSIRLGLDQDPREHVAAAQSRAHDDYLRRNRAKQQRTALGFAVIGAIISLLLLIGAVLSGTGILLAAIVCICTSITAALQAASMALESDISMTDMAKEDIQGIMSLVQNIALIVSMVSSAWLSTVASGAEMAASAAVLAGKYLQRVSAWLRNLADTLRAETKVKGALNQLDKVLTAVGLGGVAAYFRETFLGMLNHMLELGSSVGSMAKKWMQALNQEQEEEQQEQQQESDEEDEDDMDKKKHQAAGTEETRVRTLQTSDGFIITKTQAFVTVRSAPQSGSGGNGKELLVDGGALAYVISQDGSSADDAVTVTVQTNAETNEIEHEFSRPLTDEEKLLLGLEGVDDPTNDQHQAALEAIFTTADEDPRIVSDTTSGLRQTTYFDRDGKAVEGIQEFKTEAGDVRLITNPGGRMRVVVQPSGEPRPKPVYLELNGGGSLASSLRGKELTPEHLQLLAGVLGSDAGKLRGELTEEDLAGLTALAKRNQERYQAATEEQKRRLQGARQGAPADVDGAGAVGETAAHDRQGVRQPSAWERGSSWARRQLASTTRRVWRIALAYVSPFWALFSQNPLVRAVWPWLASTRLGRWVTQQVAAASERMDAWLQLALARVDTWAPSALSTVARCLPGPAARLLGVEAVASPGSGDKEAAAAAPILSEPSDGVSEPTAVRNEQDAADVAAIERMLKALLPSGTAENLTEQTEAGTPLRVDAALANSLLDAFAKQQEASQQGLVTQAAMSRIADKFGASEDDKKALLEAAKKKGLVKAMYDFLYEIAVKKAKAAAASAMPPGADSRTRGQLLHEGMAQMHGVVYSRQNMLFLKPPALTDDDVVQVAKDLLSEYGLQGKGIQQHLTAEQIQAKVEGFIRKGDQQGLQEYVRELLERPVPEQFAENGLAEKWEEARDRQKEEIGAKLQFAIERGWSQMTDDEVAKATQNLVGLLSAYVGNLWVEDKAEKLIDEAIADDKELVIEWGEKETAYRVVEVDGKFRSVVDRAAMGDIHERHVEKILGRAGFEVIDAKLPGNTGIDILAVKRDESGAVVRIYVIECKATGHARVNAPYLSNTKKGKQLSSTWIAEKMVKMYGREETREAAILLRENLDKVKTVVAFQKEGVNSWAHQNRLPEFSREEVEAIVGQTVPEWVVGADPK